MRVWLLALYSYTFGMLAMFVTLTIYSLVMSDWMELFHWIRALVTIPVTPVGLPFFIGSVYGAKKYFDRVSQKKYSILTREQICNLQKDNLK